MHLYCQIMIGLSYFELSGYLRPSLYDPISMYKNFFAITITRLWICPPLWIARMLSSFSASMSIIYESTCLSAHYGPPHSLSRLSSIESGILFLLVLLWRIATKVYLCSTSSRFKGSSGKSTLRGYSSPHLSLSMNFSSKSHDEVPISFSYEWRNEKVAGLAR
jgi:hypothetical protein